METTTIYQSFRLKPIEGGPITPVFIGNCADIKHFPRVGESITISKAKKWSNELYLEGDSEILAENPLGSQNSRLTFMLQRFDLGVTELKKFHCEFPEVDLSAVTSHSKENVKLNLLEVVMRNGRFHVPNLATTSNLIYVDLDKNYPNFPYYSHGVHHSLPQQYLVGKLMVDKSGLIILTDGLTYQHLIVATETRFEILKFNDKIVYLDKFIVFSEMYEWLGNIQYIYCQIEDIHLFGAPASQRRELCLVQHCEANKDTCRVVEIIIVNIATPSQAANLGNVCWLEVFMRNNGSPDWKSCFLCLHSDSLLIVTFLDVGGAYRIFLSKLLQEVSHVELARLAPRAAKYKIPANSAKFLPIARPQPSPFTEKPVLSIRKTVQAMRNMPNKTTECVNFEGTLFIKGFTNADSFTRTPAYSNSPKYGTPGSRRHLLRFEISIYKKTEINFTIYLNNWERLYRPMGLVGQMRLRIYNLDLSRNYAKVNAMTRFEVRGFCGCDRINCANLNSKSDVVLYAPITLGYLAPWGSLIRTRVALKACKKFLVELDQDDVVKTKIIFVGVDGLGEALLLCNGLDFFKRYLFPNEWTYNEWLEWFKRVRIYNLYEYPTLPEEMHGIYTKFHKSVRLKLCCVNVADVLCRKKEPGDLVSLRRSIWNVVKVFEFRVLENKMDL